MGVQPRDTMKSKVRRRKDLLLATSKENTRDLSQSSVSPNSKIEGVLSQGYMGIHEGVEAIHRVQALVD